VLLGDRGGHGRCLLVWASGTSLLGTVALLARSPLADGWASLAGPDRLPLDRALADLAALVLLGCTAWAWLALTATVLEAVRGREPAAAHRPWHLPGGVRRMVLAACGLALATGVSPALADGHGHAEQGASRHRHGIAVLAGLPLPDRAALGARGPEPDPDPVDRPRRGPHIVEVVRGDSLWSIATRDLAAGASDALVDARWHAIYAANRAVIGPDPDMVEPGQRLLLPPPRRDPS
jgi:hypothetical protein